jgi:hypothetical protein
VVASGVKSGGEWIESKVSTGEEKKVDPETKSNYELIKTKAKTTINVTAGFIGTIMKPIT